MNVSDRPGGSGINKVVTMRRILLRSTIGVVMLAAAPLLLHAQARSAAGGGAHGGVAGGGAHVRVHSSAPMGGHFSSGSHTATMAPHFAPGARLVRAPSGRTVLRMPAPRTASNLRPTNNRRLISQDVPGLGFDYTHLAAVGRSRGHGRGQFGDRDHDRRRSFVAYFPFFGGGYYEPLFPEEYDDNGTAADNDETEGVEPDDYPQGPPPRPEEYAQNYPPAPPMPVEAGPAKPADEYVFVRRDGTLFFAMAYAWENGTLRYVTGEGLRRSVEGNTLDLDATKQFNEQRGLHFRLPA